MGFEAKVILVNLPAIGINIRCKNALSTKFLKSKVKSAYTAEQIDKL
jgi:hypothetical protein